MGSGKWNGMNVPEVGDRTEVRGQKSEVRQDREGSQERKHLESYQVRWSDPHSFNLSFLTSDF
jgi:hypothetical protein